MTLFTNRFWQYSWILAIPAWFVVAASSHAQVSLGYRNPVVASGSMGRSFLQSTIQTNQFFVDGENVVPNDNSRVFSRSTIWIIKDQGLPFSLKTEDANPLIESTSVFEETRSASVVRTEILPVVVTGAAANALRSVFPRVSGLIESEFVTPRALGF